MTFGELKKEYERLVQAPAISQEKMCGYVERFYKDALSGKITLPNLIPEDEPED